MGGGGALVMTAEHLQAWLVGKTREKRLDTQKWEKVVDIIQSDFIEGRILVECAWKAVVLVPNGDW